MKLVVGLGNPGHVYAGTRHNVGFMVLDYLSQHPNVGSWHDRFDAEVAEGMEAGGKVLYAKPQTFMNLSGRSVRQAMDFYKIELPDVLIVCDDIHLPLGKLRVRARGSPGGHNGLKDIERHLGTQDYARLRIGIGAPTGEKPLVDYVLSRFRPGEKEPLENTIAQAAQAVLLWLRDGINVCMNRINADESKKLKPRDDA